MGRSRQINGRALWGTESGLHRVFEGSGGDAAPFFLPVFEGRWLNDYRHHIDIAEMKLSYISVGLPG